MSDHIMDRLALACLSSLGASLGSQFTPAIHLSQVSAASSASSVFNRMRLLRRPSRTARATARIASEANKNGLYWRACEKRNAIKPDRRSGRLKV